MSRRRNKKRRPELAVFNHIKSTQREKKPMAKFGEQKVVEIEGTEYTLQHPGIREAVKMRDRCKDMNGQMNEEKYYSALMEHVIVQPKVNWAYFDEHDGFNDLMAEAATFLNS
jgi:hypothetical protein